MFGVSVIGVGVRVWWCWPSGWERDRPQADERFGKGQGPGPVLGRAQGDFALAAGDAGDHVQQPVAEGFGALHRSGCRGRRRVAGGLRVEVS